MFDFLTALFGGIFYFGEISSEKAIQKAYDKEREERRDYHESISLTTDEDIALRRMFLDGDCEAQKEMLDVVSDELKEIYGENWMDNYVLGTSRFWAEVRDPWGIAYHIWVSKTHVKLPHFHSSSYDLSHGLGPIRGAYVLKACEIIERNMQKVYPELKLWFLPAIKASDKKCAEFYEELWLGELIWEHQIPRRNPKWNPPLRRLW